MRRLLGWLFTGLAAASLLLCLGAAAIWAHSFHAQPIFRHGSTTRDFCLEVKEGQLRFSRHRWDGSLDVALWDWGPPPGWTLRERDYDTGTWGAGYRTVYWNNDHSYALVDWVVDFIPEKIDIRDPLSIEGSAWVIVLPLRWIVEATAFLPLLWFGLLWKRMAQRWTGRKIRTRWRWHPLGLTGLSLLLCMAMTILWFRGLWREDVLRLDWVRYGDWGMAGIRELGKGPMPRHYFRFGPAVYSYSIESRNGDFALAFDYDAIDNYHAIKSPPLGWTLSVNPKKVDADAPERKLPDRHWGCAHWHTEGYGNGSRGVSFPAWPLALLFGALPTWKWLRWRRFRCKAGIRGTQFGAMVLWDALAFMSLLLCLTMTGLWVRSHYSEDWATIRTSGKTGLSVGSLQGELQWKLQIYDTRLGRSRWAYDSYDLLPPAPITGGGTSSGGGLFGSSVIVEDEEKNALEDGPIDGTGARWFGFDAKAASVGSIVYHPFGNGNASRAYRYWLLMTPYWFVFLVTAALPALWLIQTWRRRRLPRPGFCAFCGYDLRATPERCPECGHAVETPKVIQ